MTFTPTEQAILDVLADGLSHLRKELDALVPDELAGRCALAMHLVRLRKKLRPNGQDIISELRDRKSYYRQVRLLASRD